MSFYGNSYHYTAESFARIVLKNSGLEKYIADTPTNFTDVGTTEVHLDALRRESGIGIESGNHWIKLVYNKPNSTFQIMHNSPGGPVTTIIPFNTDRTGRDDLVSDDNQLDFGEVLKIPVITYDYNGHIDTTNSAIFYQLPANPAIALEARMNSIDGLDADGNVSEPTGGSLKKKLEDKMNNTLAEIQTIAAEIETTAEKLDTGLAQLQTVIKDTNTAKQNAQLALDDAKLVKSTFGTLEQRISALESKI